MATTADDEPTRIDPTAIDPTTIDLPPAFAERIQRVFDLETRPETYGEWAEAIVASFESGHDRGLSTDDLCDTDASSHSATLDGETTHYMCAEDPLVVGMLAAESVTVESTPPNREEPITIEFDPDGGIVAEPAGALLSFGVVEDGDGPAHVTPEAMYGLVCPYGHAFPDDEAYEEWAAETDAITDVLSVPAGIAVMERLIEAAGVEELE